MQWKRHYQSKLNVLIAQNKAISDIQKNCDDSDVICSEFHLSFERQPGDVQLEQKDKEIHACQCPTNVLLHLEAFDFVYDFIFPKLIIFSKKLWNHFIYKGGGFLDCLSSKPSKLECNFMNLHLCKMNKDCFLIHWGCLFLYRMINDRSKIIYISFWRATHLSLDQIDNPHLLHFLF